MTVAIWIRMPETIWEGDRRRSKEERMLMSNEEFYRHVADKATSHMLENIKKVLISKALEEKNLSKIVKRLPKIENKATDRLRRLPNCRDNWEWASFEVRTIKTRRRQMQILPPRLKNRSWAAFPPIQQQKADEVIEEKVL